MEYVSQLIQYYRAYRAYRACGSHYDFLDRGLLLTRKLLNQGFLVVKLKSSLRKFYGRHHDLVNHYWVSVSYMTSGYVPFAVITMQSFPHLWHINRFVSRVTQPVPLLEQELLTFLEHLSSPLFLSGLMLFDL